MAATGRMRGAQEWIMFVVAIGVVVYFAFNQTELSVGWLLLIGSMLGFSMLVAGVQKSLGMDVPDPPPAVLAPDKVDDKPDDKATVDVRKMSLEERLEYLTTLLEERVGEDD